MRVTSRHPSWIERFVAVFVAGVMIVLVLGLLSLGFLFWRATDLFRFSGAQAGPAVAGRGAASSSSFDPARCAAKLPSGVDLFRRAS